MTKQQATWYVERERISGRGLEYYDVWCTQDGYAAALARFEVTDPLPGERVYLGYSDTSQATILAWRGELAIPPQPQVADKE
jgi:hypothetical protein